MKNGRKGSISMNRVNKIGQVEMISNDRWCEQSSLIPHIHTIPITFLHSPPSSLSFCLLNSSVALAATWAAVSYFALPHFPFPPSSLLPYPSPLPTSLFIPLPSSTQRELLLIVSLTPFRGTNWAHRLLYSCPFESEIRVIVILHTISPVIGRVCEKKSRSPVFRTLMSIVHPHFALPQRPLPAISSPLVLPYKFPHSFSFVHAGKRSIVEARNRMRQNVLRTKGIRPGKCHPWSLFLHYFYT